MFNSQGTAAQKQFNTKCQVIFFLYPWKWLGVDTHLNVMNTNLCFDYACDIATIACNSRSV